MLEPFIFLLELLVFEHKPRPWILRVLRALGELPARLTWRPMDLTPIELPAGTAGATATAMQPLVAGPSWSPKPQFVNTNASELLLREYARTYPQNVLRASMH